MSVRLNTVTGPGISDHVAMVSADLGVMRRDPVSGKIAMLIGDNFEHRYLKGEWRSPSIVFVDDNHKIVGLPDGSNRVKQLWPYPHNNPEFSTVLPTDFIRIGEWWYVHVMVTAGLGNEKWTEIQRSRDLVTWEHTGVKFPTTLHNGMFVMWTMEEWKDGYIYVYSTGGLARDKPIIMHRIPRDKFPDPNAFEPWGYADGRWAWGNPPTPILEGRYGELSLRTVDGNLVLAYFDAGNYRITARAVANPTDNWYTSKVVDAIRGGTRFMESLDRDNNLSQLYGGYISPVSRLGVENGLKLAASQWITATNDPYCIIMFGTTLAPAQTFSNAPKEEAQPSEPTPEAPQEDSDMALEDVASELAASHEIPLRENNTGPRLTLRGAIERILWKTTTRLTRTTPVPITQPDDQYGHVLSMRAELADLRRALTEAGVIK